MTLQTFFLVRGIQILDAGVTIAQSGLKDGDTVQWIARGACSQDNNREDSDEPVSSSSDDPEKTPDSNREDSDSDASRLYGLWAELLAAGRP